LIALVQAQEANIAFANPQKKLLSFSEPRGKEEQDALLQYPVGLKKDK